MTRGRKPNPTGLKIIKNEVRTRDKKKRANEPVVDPAIPSPPRHLTDEAKEEWDRVVQILFSQGLVTHLDRAALAAYCMAYGRWVVAEEALARFAKNDPATQGLIIRAETPFTIRLSVTRTPRCATW